MKKHIFFTALITFCLSIYFAVDTVAAKKSTDADQQLSLHEYCEFGSFTEVRDSILSGAKVNDKDAYGLTPLMTACRGNSSVEIIQLLLSYGAKVNMRDVNGKTVLMYAAEYDMYENVIEEIIRAGAAVNAKSDDGTTALMLACENTLSPKVVAVLVKSGANVRDTDNDGYTVLDYAQGNEKNRDAIIDILRNAGLK